MTTTTTDSGLQYEDTVLGTGAIAPHQCLPDRAGLRS